MKSIVFIISTMGEGGAQRVVANLANSWCKKYKVCILTLFQPICIYDLDPDVRVYHYADMGKKPNIFLQHLPKFHHIKKFFWARKIKKNVCANVTISMMPYSNLVNAFSYRGDKVIMSERSDPSSMDKGHYRIEKFVLGLADHVVFQSNYVKTQFNKIIQKKSSIILNPVSVSVTASSFRKNRIVAVGRLVAQKNHKLLIAAFSEFLKTHPDYTLDIYGTGVLEDELKEQINLRGLESKVFLRGFVKDIHSQISDAKIFVLSSMFEGLSNALLEAMMMGIACISTKVAGSTEIIRSMENGILVDIGDQEMLTRAMSLLADDDDLRKKIEKNALSMSEEFRAEVIISQWEKHL